MWILDPVVFDEFWICYTESSNCLFIVDCSLIIVIRRLNYIYPIGGFLLGGGGFFIPSLKYSPVSFLFHPTLWFMGKTIVIAPSTGQCSTQHPQNQHSSGYMTYGGLPFSWLGIKRSERQTSTHELQPMQSSGFISTHSLGMIGLGVKQTWSSILS